MIIKYESKEGKEETATVLDIHIPDGHSIHSQIGFLVERKDGSSEIVGHGNRPQRVGRGLPPHFLYDAIEHHGSMEKDYRLGQAFFNKYSEYSPEHAQKISGTDIDPFQEKHFDSSTLVAFLRRVFEIEQFKDHFEEV